MRLRVSLRTLELLVFLLEQQPREGDSQMLPAAAAVPWPDGAGPAGQTQGRLRKPRCWGGRSQQSGSERGTARHG